MTVLASADVMYRLGHSAKHSFRTKALSRKTCILSSSLNDVVMTGVEVVVSGSFVLSSLRLLNAVARLPSQPQQNLVVRIADDRDEDAFVWSVATVVSLIPVFNFMAWSMAAQSTDSPKRFYTLSAVYALAAATPLLTGTVPLASVLLYMLGVLHVQVELTAAINPEAAEKVLGALPGKGKQLIAAGDRTARTMSAFMEALDYTIQKEMDPCDPSLSLKEKNLLEEDMKSMKELQQLEISDWDDKLQNRGRRNDK